MSSPSSLAPVRWRCGAIAISTLVGLALMGCETEADRLAAALASQRATANARRDGISIPSAPVGLEGFPALPPSAARIFLAAPQVELDRSPTATTPDAAALVSLGRLADDGTFELRGTEDARGHWTGLALGSGELHEVAIYADRGAPASALAQTIAALAELAGPRRAYLVSGSSARDATHGLALRPIRLTRRRVDDRSTLEPDLPPTPEPALDLELVLSADGAVRVLGSGGWVEPGCRTVSQSEVVIAGGRNGRPDVAVLETCFGAIEAQFPDEAVGFVRTGDARIEQLAEVLAAAARTHLVDELVLLPAPLYRQTLPPQVLSEAAD